MLALGLGSSAVADNDQCPRAVLAKPLEMLCRSGCAAWEQGGFHACRELWVLFNSCTVTTNKSMLYAWAWIFSDSGWNVGVVLQPPGQLRPIWKSLHRFGVLKRLPEMVPFNWPPCCAYYNFTALGAALQVQHLWLYSDFMFSSTHEVPKAFLFNLGLKFCIATQSLQRHA